jgi:ABC-type branched-subunit amino acid transport system substrate-binding protein
VIAQDVTAVRNVNVGLILSESGPAKEISRSWLQGVQLAIERLGKQGKTVLIRTEDAGSSASKTAKAYKSLVENYKVEGIVGGSLPYLLERLVPLTKIHKVPVVSPSVPQEALSSKAKNTPLVRTMGYSIEGAERPLEKFFRQHLTRSCAIVRGDSRSEAAWAKVYRQAALGAGCELVYEKEITFKNYRTQLVSAAVSLSRKNPDVVMLPLDSSGIQIMSRELFRLRDYPLFVTGPEFVSSFELSPSGEHFKNFFVLYPEYFAEEFYSDFYKKFGTKPSLYSASGYDAMVVLYSAIVAKRSLGEISRSETLMKDSMVLKRVVGDMLEEDTKKE